MNLKEIEYIVTLAEEGKLARAAQRLFITPSALTQQVSNLEHEIGLPLFERSPKRLVSHQGRSDLPSSAPPDPADPPGNRTQASGSVRLPERKFKYWCYSEHGTTTFTHIYPAFHKQFPEVTINIYEANVRAQQQMIRTGKLDLGILTLSEEQQTEDLYIPLAQEEILLAIPSLHPACGKAVLTEKSPYPELDPNLVRYEPFAMMYEKNLPCMR
ncbi:MAG: LysR family transcriptional regulator [Clostridium sp.]